MKGFINFSFVEFQDLHPFKNLTAEQNQKGLLFKIRHRKFDIAAAYVNQLSGQERFGYYQP